MEDIGKIIVSIIAAIIYFIYSSNKNIKQQQTRRPGTMPSQEQPEKPQKPPAKVSFEELLKELETKIQEQLPQPPAEESIEDRKNRNKKNVEPVLPEKQFSYQDKYQQTEPLVATKKPNCLTKPQTPPPAAGSPKVNKEITAEIQHPIATLLTDANQLRSAFVLSEIFNRKW